MFGFGKKKEPPQRPERARRSEEFEERKAQSRAQLGFLVGIDDDGGGSGGGIGGSFEVDDVDLENELLMLIGDGGSPSKVKPKSAPPPRPRAPGLQKKPAASPMDFEDEGDDDDGDDLDLDDPDLQAELGEILGEDTPPPVITPEENVSKAPEAPVSMSQQQLASLLQERLSLYEKAKVNADTANETSKSRRFTRGIKTLKELLGKAQAGRVVDEADIPPPVSAGGAAAAPPPPPKVTPAVPDIPPVSSMPEVPVPDYEEPSFPTLPEPLKPTIISSPKPSPVDSEVQPIEPPVDYDMNREEGQSSSSAHPEAELRLKEYKLMAVTLKRNQELIEALKYLKLSKVLEGAIASGHPLDISLFPPVPIPSEFEVNAGPAPGVEVAQVPPVVAPPPTETATVETSGDAPAPETSDIFGAPPPPKTVMEALEQRLEKYKSEVEKANSAANSSKARRMGRIVKQYEDAISSHKKGKPVPFDDLPAPPGFAPIPGHGGPVGGIAFGSIPDQIPVTPQSAPGQILNDDSTSPEKKIKPSPPQSTSRGPAGISPGSLINRAGKPVSKLTLQEKQLTLIMGRQKQYRDAAIGAKKRGDINQAREYLRISKGFDNLIEASKSGLPVDLTTVPAPPEDISALEAEDFEVVSEGDCLTPPGNLTEVYSKLEEDLKQQMKMCMRTRDHFKNIGDVASANRFESMALETKRDLDTLRLAAKKGQELPKYHYENKVFSITECNTEIKDDEIEISILRGINLKGSSDLDTYVRVELPYPSAEEAQSQKSNVVKNTTDPEYNVTYKMNVNRTARNFQRFVHRHGVKVEVWSKGGFLRSSTLLGTATAKLQPLESKCILHDAFDVIDGRKVVGKIEAKIRLREPVLTKQITQKKEKWLSIDRA